MYFFVLDACAPVLKLIYRLGANINSLSTSHLLLGTTFLVPQCTSTLILSLTLHYRLITKIKILHLYNLPKVLLDTEQQQWLNYYLVRNMSHFRLEAFL